MCVPCGQKEMPILFFCGCLVRIFFLLALLERRKKAEMKNHFLVDLFTLVLKECLSIFFFLT